MATLNHLAITVTDLEKSRPWYDAFLSVLGYTPHLVDERICTWHGQVPEVLVYPMEGEDHTPHTHGRPGWQHLAFQVDDRATVESAGRAAVDAGGVVVHQPQEYPGYAPGYYAVFVTDGDGIRWEVFHKPEPSAA